MRRRGYKKLWQLFTIAAGVCCILAGCMRIGSQPVVVIDNEMKESENEKQMENDEVKSIGVYIDATPSIEGFLGLHKSNKKSYPKTTKEQEEKYKEIVPVTIYKKSLKQINNILYSNFQTENINFYSVDTTLWKTDKDILSEAEEPQFYIDSIYKVDYEMAEGYEEFYSSEYLNPSLSYAIENTQKEDFSVIITDLYENNSSSNELIRKLRTVKEKKSGENNIILLGIKSQYAGRVYDLIGNQKVDYGAGEALANAELTWEDIKYRPYYIILIGNKDKTKLFIDEFNQNMDSKNVEIEMAVFEEDKIYGLDFEDYVEFRTNKFLEIRISDIDVYNEKKDINLQLVDVNRKKISEEEKIYLYYDISEKSLRNYLEGKQVDTKQVITVDEEEMEVYEVDNWYVQNTMISAYDSNQEKFVSGHNVKEAMAINGVYWIKDENQIVLECNMHKNKFSKGIYKFEGEILCKTEDEGIGWITEWNSSSDKFEGEKTQNLNNFYNAIKNIYQPVDKNIVKFMFYFKADK